MGRASLLQTSRQRIQALSKAATSVPNQPQIRSELTNLCVDAAKATIELILVLKKHNLLCHFSFTDHHAATAALIILILYSITQQGDETSRIIGDGIDMLRYIARGGCLGASSDLQTVEQLSKLASDLRLSLYRTDGDTSVPMQPTSMTNSYQAWVNWMSEQEASKAYVAGHDHLSSQVESESLHDASDVRGACSSENLQFDFRLPEQENMSWYFDASNRSTMPGEISRGVEWDDGRLDLLDITQFFGNYTGQNTYGQG